MIGTNPNLNLGNLPEYVIYCILEAYIGFDSLSRARRRSCWSLGLICRAWYLPSITELYRDIKLEYSSSKKTVQLFSCTISSHPHLAHLVRSFDISNALISTGGFGVQPNYELSSCLRDIMKACERLEYVSFQPGKGARNFEELYLEAWKLGQFTSFRLVISEFRDLVLLPFNLLKRLVIELAQGSEDLLYDYDLLSSWPKRTLQVEEEISLINLPLPAYSDQVMLEKLDQLCRAIQPARRLKLFKCTLSTVALDQMLKNWAKKRTEEIWFVECRIVGWDDRPVECYKMPELPSLKRLMLQDMKTRVRVSDVDQARVMIGTC